MRAVVDVNILVRAIIKPDGTVGPVVRRLRDGAFTLLYSEAILEELLDVLSRPRIRTKYHLEEQDIEPVLMETVADISQPPSPALADIIYRAVVVVQCKLFVSFVLPF